MSEENFEEGKPVEEYVRELDDLVIPEEPSSQTTQRLEDIIEPPIKNEKKKPIAIVEPKKDPAPEVPKPTQKPVAPNIPVIPVEQPKIINQDLPPPPEDCEVPKYPSLDGMITKAVERKKVEIFEKAKAEAEQFEARFYDGLVALVNSVANGSVIPLSQNQSQQALPPPTIQVDPKDEELKEIKAQLKIVNGLIEDPRVKNFDVLLEQKTDLLKRKNNLLGISEAVEDKKESDSTVSSQESNEPVKTPNKPTSSVKTIIAGGLASFFGVVLLVVSLGLAHVI
jgi:hypothetical protein